MSPVYCRTLSLLPHPSALPHDAAAVTVEVSGGDSSLRLNFHVAMSGLRIPAPMPPARVDGLWQRTCCELFIGTADRCAYREFNFSPSGEWAAYDFTDYRVPAAALPEGKPPLIRTRSGDEGLELDVVLDAAWLALSPQPVLGLSVVSETADGGMAWWALHHPSARPDFHDAATRTLLPDTRT